ncbi:MAG: Ig-like domain-containing protein [Acidobacteria bacterium]|nr:Ig-like domain-containing protein [Acidobacteriota bacterium]
MKRNRIVHARAAARCVTAACAVVALLASCGFIALERLRVVSFPSERNQIIGRGERITLSFSIPPDRNDAERLATISAPNGIQGLDFAWEADVLTLLPIPPPPAGERLVLGFSGTLSAADGREFAVALEIPFFVETDAPQPRLSARSPEDGAVAGTETALVLTFSEQMDAESFAEGFVLSPSTGHDTAWSADGKIATLTPKEKWETLTLYAWEVPGTVRDARGVKLGVPYSGCFLVQADALPPRILSLRPAVPNGDGTFTVVEQALDGNLRARDGIALSFSEDVPIEALRRSFRLDPSIRGHLARERAGEFLFVPEEPYRMATVHHLVVSTDLEDLAGNRMAEELSCWFTPDIPPQAVLSVTANGGPALVLCSSLTADVPLTVEREIVFAVGFAQPFDEASKAVAPLLVLCEAVFPSSILDPALKSAAWTSDTSLALAFAGFSPSAAQELHYYRLIFPGGSTGIRNSDGSYLEEDAWVAFVAR